MRTSALPMRRASIGRRIGACPGERPPGALGFLIVRPQLFVEGDPSRTLANLIERDRLARIGIALELGTVTFQALAAVWFARLFRDSDAFAAGTLALFGMVNAIVVLASAALLRAALDIAVGSIGADLSSHVLILMGTRFWEVGNIFFGLWLIPMGWLVWKASFGHRALGWILVVGGVGYVLMPYVSVLAPNAGAAVGLLSLPVTIGEFWMIGLLLWTCAAPEFSLLLIVNRAQSATRSNSGLVGTPIYSASPTGSLRGRKQLNL